MININWQEQLKIRIRESQESQYKHLLVKSLLMLAIRIKKSKNLKNQIIYSEFPICEGKICDILNEDIKEKAVYCYEIQEDTNNKWIEETNKIYQDYETLKTKGGFKSVNWILIKLKEMPETHEQIWDCVKKQVI